MAFIRAINVAGHTSVKMSDVRDAFVAAGCRDVRTYIQSGNVMFEFPRRARAPVLQKIRVKLRDLLDDRPEVVFRSVRELEGIVRAAPFKRFETERDIKLYVGFLFRKPSTKPRFPLVSSGEALEVVAMKKLEVFVVSRRKSSGFYGFPNNFVEQQLGVMATSRNWSTLTKIVGLIRRAPAG
ncbi:MAG TPA: DUF1697 domain-containing protein [Gemmatimonadales bacterium]|nr:DUF1697 domain-containing protein [Gemmatimonadales bacterium]